MSRSARRPRFGSSALELQPFWTEADDAELDLLTHELLKAAWAHRERCSVCSQGGQWCEPLVAAFDGVLEWRRGRVLKSKAAWLRARQTAVEEWAAA